MKLSPRASEVLTFIMVARMALLPKRRRVVHLQATKFDGGRRMNPSKEPIHITDHAVLRYLERAMGLNVELVRDHMATLCAGAVAFGAVAVRAEGLRFQIDGNRVCTVVPDTVLPGRTQRAQAQNRIARA